MRCQTWLSGAEITADSRMEVEVGIAVDILADGPCDSCSNSCSVFDSMSGELAERASVVYFDCESCCTIDKRKEPRSTLKYLIPAVVRH